MKTLIPFTLAFLAATSLFAADPAIQIGGTSLVIPPASGFVAVTKEMAALDQFFEASVTPQNQRFLTFIPEEFLPAVQRGEVPQIARTLSVQTTKEMVGRNVSRAEFGELRKFMREENARLMEQVKKEMPGAMEQLTKKMEGQLDSKVDLNVSGMIPFPPHDETDRTMAFSMMISYDGTTAAGQPAKFSSMITATFLHVRGCLLFLYVTGAENDLEWTRTTAREWAAAVVAANPPDAASEAVESRSSRRFSWNRVVRGAIIGGVVGLVFGLGRWLGNRKKNAG